MKIRTLIIAALVVNASLLFSQVKVQAPQFDREKEKEAAIKSGMPAEDLDGYLFTIEREFYDKLDAAGKTPVDPYAWSAKGPGGAVISGAACVNASFENTNFGNWTGSTGNSNTCGPAGAQSPNYTQIGATIVSPAGPNAGLTNTQNYHTIMTIPATNPNFPTCNQFGYDSISVKVVGTQTVSEVPHVCPYYGDGKSVRMNGAMANYRACKLRYNFALTPFNRNITYAFALVFYGAHTANQQPYFKVSVLDQNNNPVGGNCGVYNVNGLQAATDTSFRTSALNNSIKYRVWRQYGVDLTSPLYATVTAVNLEFTVGGCCAGGHYGYAYVDAECSQGGTYSAMCAGTNSAVLTAPLGYVAYQWYSLPSNTPQSPAVGGNTPSLTVNPAIVGQVFQVKMTTPTGCTIVLNDTVKISGVNITNMQSSPTCQGGSSGSATVSVAGSNTGYNYTWVNSANSIVSTTNTAQNLPPGVYTVSVTAISCGIATATVQVGVAPPTYYMYNQNFCGNLAIITATTGTGYTWYNSGGVIASAAGSQSLVVNNPVNNAVYTVVYTTPQGCKDSVRYTMKQIAGGSIYMSNVKEICPTSPNVAYAVVNLSTTQTGPYSYTVTGSSYNHVLNNTTAIKDSLTGLALGSYSVAVFDGACFYNTTFSVTPYNFTYTVSPSTPTVLCVSGVVPMGVSLSNTTAPVCGGAAAAGCANPKVATIGTALTTNAGIAGFPCVYGGYYDVCRHQMLFTAADLAAAGIQPGTIPSLQFMVKSMLPVGNNTQSYIGTLQGFTIKMKCTNLTVLNNVWDNAGFTTVLNPVNYSPTTGWNIHNFNTAFNWDGVSGILVDVCFNWVQANPYTSNPIMPYTNTGVAKTRYFYSSNQSLCGLNTTCIASVNRPNVRFGNCPITKVTDFTYQWTPNVALTSNNTQSTSASPTTSTIYTITVNPIDQVNCAQTQTVDIQVVNPVTPTITSGVFCTNFAPTAINVSPTNGTWTPTAYMNAGGIFTPSLAAVGANTVAYTTGTGTCSAASTLTINVEQFNPATLTGSVSPLCVTDPIVNLMTIVANGTGTWTGTGITGNNFDPNGAGPGTYNITYNTNSVPTLTLCPDVSTLQINVHTVNQPTITQVGPYCNNMAPTQLIVSPTGGVYSGLNNPAVSPNGLFDPQLAIIGANTIGYTVTSGPCSKATSIDINVEKFNPATITGTAGPFCHSAAAFDLNSITSPGGTWSGPGVVGTNFDPSLAGSGNFVISYNTNSVPTVSLCPDVATIDILVNPKPVVGITTSTLQGCRPVQVEFNVPTVNDGTGIWNFGDNTTANGLSAIHTYTAPGSYFASFDYYDNIGCRLFTQIPTPIVVHDLPKADFKVLPDYIVSIADPTVEFINTSTVLEKNTYFWNIGNYMHSSNTNASFTFGTYGYMYITLAATNEFGCSDTITKVVEVKNDYGLWVPNAFTPNGDGLNDEFKVSFSQYGLDYTDFEMDIFDRWGERLFSTKEITSGWNGAKFNKGEPLKEDVYVYKIRYKTAQKEVKYKTGHVTLIK